MASRECPAEAASCKQIATKIKKSSQSDYPTLSVPAQVECVTLGLNELVAGSSLIVDATVVEVLPDEKKEYNPDSSVSQAYAKRGVFQTQYTVKPVVLHINQVIKGNLTDKEITMYLAPVQIDCAPKFKTGDRLVFMLNPYVIGGYSPSTCQQSYYYVSNDNKIYPALLSNESKNISGMSLNNFVSNINSITP